MNNKSQNFKLWVNVGELSGDMQAASLIKALKKDWPSLDLCGMGGPHLAECGQRNIIDIDKLSVMGIFEVVSVIPKFFAILKDIEKKLKEERPQAILLVDAPELSFRVAKIAHKLDIPVYYFIPPKVWAWRCGRVHFLQKYVKKLLCILPFEKDFYKKHGLEAEYVGNPLVDLVNYENIKDIEPIKGRIGLMPGSRKKEVEKLLPLFAEVAAIMHKERPSLEFHCLQAQSIEKETLLKLWAARFPDGRALPLHIYDDEQDRYAFMRSCQCMLAASGTATLETALAGVPTLVAYKMTGLPSWLLRRVIQVPYAALPNIILQKELFPEFLQEKADSQLMAGHLKVWLADDTKLDPIYAGMNTVRELCGEPGAATKAANILKQCLRR